MPAMCSPSRSTTSRRTPCVEGWFGPKLTVRMSSSACSAGSTWSTVGIGLGIREPSYTFAPWSTTLTLLLPREPDGRAADRVILAQGVTLPVVLHQDPGQVGMAAEDDPEHVPRLALEPVGGRPDGDDRVDLLAVVQPGLHADADGIIGEPEEVVVD